MSYRNGSEILPAELLSKIQHYIEGELIYIPKVQKRMPWGAKSGTRHTIHKRNKQIMKDYQSGTSVNALTHQYCLSEASIKKIISKQKRKSN